MTTAHKRKLSPTQKAALELVAAGRVTYGDPYPDATRRIAARLGGTTRTDMVGHPVIRPVRVSAYAVMGFLVDGNQVYGQQGRTYSSLADAGLITVHSDELPADDTGSCCVTVTDPAGVS